MNKTQEQEARTILSVLIKSCIEGFTGKWDAGSVEGRDGFSPMIDDLRKLRALVFDEKKKRAVVSILDGIPTFEKVPVGFAIEIQDHDTALAYTIEGRNMARYATKYKGGA